MDARMSQQAMEGLSDEPEFGEKRREPEGQVVGGISLGTFLLPQESTSPVGARTHHCIGQSSVRANITISIHYIHEHPYWEFIKIPLYLKDIWHFVR